MHCWYSSSRCYHYHDLTSVDLVFTLDQLISINRFSVRSVNICNFKLVYLIYDCNLQIKKYKLNAHVPSSQSCSHFDRKFVKKEIIEYLENCHGFSLCVHERDFSVGATIPDNIEAATNHSHHMIMVVSRYRKYVFCFAKLNSILYY